MKTGIVILARYNSSRLLGKALMEINGKKILNYILERLEQVVLREDIILATSSAQSDDVLEQWAIAENISCYRGSLENVADRFYNASISKKWDYAVRINGDNIFTDTVLLRQMLKLTAENKYAFISNVKGRTFPKGMSIEIVDLKHFASLLPSINNADRFKEHVMLYMYEHEQDDYCFIVNSSNPQAAGLQMALDTKEDLQRAISIISNFKKEHWNYNMNEILEIWNKIEHENI